MSVVVCVFGTQKVPGSNPQHLRLKDLVEEDVRV